MMLRERKVFFAIAAVTLVGAAGASYYLYREFSNKPKPTSGSEETGNRTSNGEQPEVIPPDHTAGPENTQSGENALVQGTPKRTPKPKKSKPKIEASQTNGSGKDAKNATDSTKHEDFSKKKELKASQNQSPSPVNNEKASDQSAGRSDSTGQNSASTNVGNKDKKDDSDSSEIEEIIISSTTSKQNTPENPEEEAVTLTENEHELLEEKMANVVETAEPVVEVSTEWSATISNLDSPTDEKVEYESLICHYVTNQTPELRELLEIAHQKSIEPGGKNVLLHILGEQLPPLDDYLQPFFESPWKPLLGFDNEEIPSDEILDLIARISPEEAQSLPLAPGLSFLLSEELRDKYVEMLKLLKDCERNPSLTPFATEFRFFSNLPKPAQVKVRELLDEGWNARAALAVKVYCQMDALNFTNKYPLMVQTEVQHLVSLIWRKSSKPSTHITRAEFDDIFSAFRKLKTISAQIDSDSEEAFTFDLLKKIKEMWANDFSTLWNKYKSDPPELLKRHNNRSQRLVSIIRNLSDLVPASKEACMKFYLGQQKSELDTLLTLILDEAWKLVKDKEPDVQKKIMQKAFEAYVESAGYYGITPIETDDPIALYKERVPEGTVISF